MKKKKYKNFVIKGDLLLIISAITKILGTYINAKSVTVKERVLLDHLKGSPDISFLETVYKYGDYVGMILTVVSAITLVIAIGCFSIVIKNKYIGGKNK